MLTLFYASFVYLLRPLPHVEYSCNLRYSRLSSHPHRARVMSCHMGMGVGVYILTIFFTLHCRTCVGLFICTCVHIFLHSSPNRACSICFCMFACVLWFYKILFVVYIAFADVTRNTLSLVSIRIFFILIFFPYLKIIH